MNSKGSVFEFFIIIMMFFLFAILSVVGVYIFGIAKNTPGLADVAGTFATFENAFLLMGASLLIFLFGAIIVAATLASKVQAHPAFIAVGIFLLFPVVILAVGLSASWTDIATSGFGAAANQIFGMNTVMANLPLLTIFGSMIIMGAMYAGYKYT